MNANKRNLPRKNYNERYLSRKLSKDYQQSENIETTMPNPAFSDNYRSVDDTMSNMSVTSEVNPNWDVGTAEIKLKAKTKLIEKYEQRITREYVQSLTKPEQERRIQFVQKQVYYINDFLDYAFLVGNEELQETSAEYLDRAQSLVDLIKEYVEHSVEGGNEELEITVEDHDTSKEAAEICAEAAKTCAENTGTRRKAAGICAEAAGTCTESIVTSKETTETFKSEEVTKANHAKAEYLINSIALITNYNIDDSETESKLQSIFLTDIPFLEKKIEYLNRFSNDLSSDEKRYGVIISKMTLAGMKASSWIHEAMLMVKRKRVDIIDDSKHNAEPIKLKPYDGWKTDENIFNFLNDFEKLYGNARPSTKAAALFKNYLSDQLASEVSHLYATNDYDSMVEYLVTKYGNSRRIVNAKKALLQNLKYNNKDTEIQIIFLRTFYQTLLNLETLISSHSERVRDIGNEVYNQAFLQNLPLLMPEYHKKRVLKELSKSERRANTQLSDKEEFLIIKKYMKDELEDLEYAVAKCPISTNKSEVLKDKEEKPKKIGVHSIDVKETKKGDDNKKNTKFNKKTNENTNKKEKRIWLKCPMHSLLADAFSHPVGSCQEFCVAQPDQRLNRVQHYKLCVSCLGDWCGRNKEECINLDKVPGELICGPCRNTNPTRPLNILLCSKHKHNLQNVTSALKYLPGYKEGDNIQLNHVEIFHMNDYDTKEIDNAYNVTDGSIQTVDSSIEVQEQDKNPALYMFQMLKIAGRPCLTMYDSGSSGEAVQGDFALSAGFTCVDNRNQKVNVAGGGTINTGYGIFRCVLGPLEDGRYVRKVMVGLKNITKEIPEYNLTTINNEVSGISAVRNEKLPQVIGGMQTKLLIGIDSTDLLPEKIYQLPNGLAVFKAKLRDIYGSRIIYAGPHKAFNKIDSQYNSLEFNSMTILFKELCNSYQHSLVSSMIGGYYCKDEQEVCSSTLIKFRSHDDVNLTDLNATAIEETPYESCKPVSQSIHHNEQFQDENNASVNETVICVCCGDPTDASNTPELNLTIDTDNQTTVAAEQVENIMADNIAIHKIRRTAQQTKQIKDDEDFLVYTYRCPKCQNCQTCLMADKTQMLSIKEMEEDHLITSSITWDKCNKKMYCKYPWTHDPFTTLPKLWGKNTNKSQAHAILRQQMRKPKLWKDGALSFHAELIKKGFVCKLSDLKPEQQDIIKNSKILHYFPWRVVAKPDSVSTPYRIVTDPSVTHMNSLLAKGSNTLSSLYVMLVKFRLNRVAYSYDLSKMYNTLKLHDTMLPFSLYLMSENLEEHNNAEEWVFLTLIYGLIAAGNLAMFAVRLLAEQFRVQEPRAHSALTEELYMDDGFGSDSSIEEVKATVDSVSRVLPEGGFSIKCVTVSGTSPSNEASSDGVSTGVGGYVWQPKEDYLKIGMGEMNFNKKYRGYRKPNDNPIVEEDDLDQIIPKIITRRLALSKTAETWDICGIWELAKVKFKLDLKDLTVYDWDDDIGQTLAKVWRDNFHLMAKIQKILIPRTVVPIDAIDPNKLELLIACDASVKMTAAVCYVRFRLKQGGYSCSMLTAKSRSVDSTIPRNELSSNVLAAEMFVTLSKAFGDKIESYYVFTDSMIALSWLSNAQKLLKPFCFNRVRQVQRLADITRWRFVPGTLNPADHATKGDVKEELLDPNSVWFKGYEWMKEDLKDPIKSYDEVYNSISTEDLDIINKETVVENIPVEINVIQKDITNKPENLINFVKLGFRRAFYRLALVIKFVSKLKHGVHLKKKETGLQYTKCNYCPLKKTNFDTQPFLKMEEKFPNHHKINEADEFAAQIISSSDRWITWNYLHKSFSAEAKLNLSNKKLKGFVEKDGIYYSGGRLSTLDHIKSVEDLDNQIKPFYENIKYLNPVALVTNPVVYSLMIHVHTAMHHCGVERLVNSTFKILYVERCRTLARKIRQDCIMCKLKLLNTYETQIAGQSEYSYTIAPPFYACQIDIISKFKAHDIYVRTTKECHVLILVCCLTQAVALYVMENYDTASVVAALVRHSARYAWPKFLLPDEGSQLLKLKDLKFDLRDLQSRLWTEQQVILDPCSPKSHWEHGRVESRISCVRDTLKSMFEFKNSIIGWETIMASISSTLNSIPITRGNDDRGVSNHEFDLITPFSCILGHNSNRTLDGVVLLENLPSRHLEKVKVTLQAYYEQLMNTIHRLIPTPNKWTANDIVKVGDVVLFLSDDGMKYKSWKYGMVIDNAVNGRTTKLKISYKNASEKTARETYRHPRNCVPIWREENIDFNTTAHFRAFSAQQKYEKPE